MAWGFDDPNGSPLLPESRTDCSFPGVSKRLFALRRPEAPWCPIWLTYVAWRCVNFNKDECSQLKFKIWKWHLACWHLTPCVIIRYCLLRQDSWFRLVLARNLMVKICHQTCDLLLFGVQMAFFVCPLFSCSNRSIRKKLQIWYVRLSNGMWSPLPPASKRISRFQGIPSGSPLLQSVLHQQQD